MARFRKTFVHVTLGLAAAGIMFAGGCSLQDIGSYFVHYNYGGTVLNISPTNYRFLTSGYKGPGVNPDIDPACTFPPFCANDPFVGP